MFNHWTTREAPRSRFLKNLIHFVMAVLGHGCFVRAFSGCSEQGLLVGTREPLIVVASLVAEHKR